MTQSAAESLRYSWVVEDNFVVCSFDSGGLQQPGSSEWRVAETNRQRGNDRLLHITSEMESTMW